MRQFNHTSPKSPSLLSHRLEIWWYAAMPVLIIGVIAACGFWAGLRYYQSSDEPTVPGRSAEASQLQLNDAEFESDFLDRYIKAKYLGEMNLSKKLYVAGTYANNDGIQVFTGTFDLKGNGEFRLESTETVELEFVEGVLVSQVSPLFESEANVVSAFIDAMQDPLLTFKQVHKDEPLKLEPTQYMGVDAYEAHIETNNPHINTTLTISTAGLAVLERYNHARTDPAQKYSYSEYRTVAGIRLPHSISIKDQLGGLSRVSLNSLDLESKQKASLARF